MYYRTIVKITIFIYIYRIIKKKECDRWMIGERSQVIEKPILKKHLPDYNFFI